MSDECPFPEKVYLASPHIIQTINGHKQVIGMFLTDKPAGGNSYEYSRIIPKQNDNECRREFERNADECGYALDTYPNTSEYMDTQTKDAYNIWCIAWNHVLAPSPPVMKEEGR